MDRYQFAHMIKRVLHLHYRVQITGMEKVLDGKVHLILPNHAAYVDPVIIGGECWQIRLRPMSDAWLMKNPFFAYVLRKVEAIVIPDVAAAPAAKRAEVAEEVRNLSKTAIDTLLRGEELCFYPSGHVTFSPKEEIGNRRLAYEVCQNLPDNVEVLLARTRGLEHSRFSHMKRNFRLFRKVNILFEDHTAEVREWAQTLDRKAFNERLEAWYNADLA